jgi:ADP-dependent NAD(P)H-hydrate dehydratase / NAD(P)H-hydrate epimerase
VPSGVNASTGEVPGAAVRADVTVSFGAAKAGLAVAPGRFYSGSVHVAWIGLEPAGHEHSLVAAQVLDQVPRKRIDSTKYRAGSVLVIGGSPGLTGAPSLAALAAFRADAGYVTVATPESALPALEARLLEAVKRGLPEDAAGRVLPRSAEAVLEAAERADAVVLGPGLGRSDGTRDFVRVLLDQLSLPVVLDADALWELDPFQRAGATVMTPHAGELARLLGEEASEIEERRLESVRRAASIFGSVVLLKGADTLVAAPREGVLVSGFGAPSLATAGTGDVLSGVIGAFLAKGMEPRLAAAAGAAAHGLASRLAVPQAGLVASDLLPLLPRVLDGEGWGIDPL